MRKPFKAGRWTLDLHSDGEVWRLAHSTGVAAYWTDADLRHIARLCAKALAYRARGKAASK